jgi:hypothetical protein
MLTTIKGYYEQGHIIMEEDAPVQKRTQVIITFLTDDTMTEKTKKRIPGALKGKVSIPDDFNDPLEDLKEYM